MATNSNIETLSTENFANTVATGVTLVDFYADWCGPCKRLSPILEQVATELQGQAKIVKVDVDSSPEIAAQYEVTSMPTLILLKNGQEVSRAVGMQDAQALNHLIKKAL